MANSTFYISSRGSSATEWLAKMLSRHPQLVCFRSTRSFPPYSPGHAEVSADAFMEGLLECGRATHGEKKFGSTHGFHGLLAKNACEKRGGIFSYIIRHPVARVHSAYIAYLDSQYYKKFKIPMENKDIHERVCSNLLASTDLLKYTEIIKPRAYAPSSAPQAGVKALAKKYLPQSVISGLSALKDKSSRRGRSLAAIKEKSGSGAPSERESAALWFVSLANEFLGFDRELFNGCSMKHAIKMEEMVKSPEYFKKQVWPLVAPEFDVQDDYFTSICSGPRFNVHRDKALSHEEIWRSWPRGMQDAFMVYFKHYDMAEICRAFDYDSSFL